jgi:hypothetical protein
LTRLAIYSPAPPTTALHELNCRLFEPFARVVAMPLPDSINAITDKRHQLPIVTTVDFLPARDKTGPPWHAYERANTDLKLVCALYEVAFGILAFRKGPRIGVPPRPSSVRVLTEALLRDGWGILDEVELVDLRPHEVGPERVDATSWNLLLEGSVPLLPNLKGSWLPVSEDAVAAINRSNPFKIDRIPALNILSFKQGLAAWDSTEDSVVLSLLQRLPQATLDWPTLAEELVHPAALQYFSASDSGRLQTLRHGIPSSRSPPPHDGGRPGGRRA